MKYRYDPSYYPAIPAIEIWLAVPEQTMTVGPLTAIVDTGADGTLVPMQIVRRLPSLLALDRKTLRSQWGEPRVVRTCWVDVGIAGVRLPAIEIVADTQGGEVILGRNVLNRLKILLDGPQEILDVTG